MNNHQYNEADFIAALKSDSDGLVENTLFQIVYHQLLGFEMFSENILKELESLKNIGKTGKIKKYSAIAIQFFEKYDFNLKTEINSNFLNQDKFFDLISNVLQERELKTDNNYSIIK